MRIVRTVADLRTAVRSARDAGAQIGLVPTMGALHAGHLALVRQAREQSGFVVVSIFVNPAQFNDPSDLARYPRDEAADAAMLSDVGTDVLFAPTLEEVYPAGFATTVSVAGLSEPLEGVVRGAKHFQGVATVVIKMLNMVQPDEAVIGQKDAQQALVIRRLVRDLNLPVRIEIHPTVREPDGLAMSSRNVQLDADARRRAPAISRALHAVEAAVTGGERDTARALAAGAPILADAQISPEYFAAVSTDTLEPIGTVTGETLIAIAARVGAVRLIDNVIVAPGAHP
ncbi:MAG: pantoate--beta-alanine ligase [bacterium]